jgi:predicted type IV restriction endonuclease
LTTLGYDVANPDEVFPEHHADFSEKYQNKVDYAILHHRSIGNPVNPESQAQDELSRMMAADICQS